jgi:nucleotide-binding universal stress UspA family protein
VIKGNKFCYLDAFSRSPQHADAREWMVRSLLDFDAEGIHETERIVIAFKHILCPVDFSEFSNRSLDHAVALARWHDSNLTVLHVVPTFEPVPVRGELGYPIQIVNPWTHEEVVAEMRRKLDVAGVPADAVLTARAGDASTTIVDEAVTSSADLIVMGTHGRRGFKRLLLGSVTETVLREAPCPVLTVPPHTPPGGTRVVEFKRILCPIDFSPSSLQALGFALDLARQSNGTLTLLHVVEWLAEEDPMVNAHFNVPEVRGHVRKDSEDRLRALVAAESQTGCEIENVVAFGRAHREILRAAETTPPDLIVMGAQGRGGFGLALFGSTTQQVLRGASSPVLTVRGPLP